MLIVKISGGGENFVSKRKVIRGHEDCHEKQGKAKTICNRMARAAIKNVEIDKRKDLEDNEVIEVLAKEVKQRRDSSVEYQEAGKDDVVADLNKEIEILSVYLPEELSKEEIEELVTKVIYQLEASSIQDMGKVMGAIMPKVRGRADGSVVNAIVREKLSLKDR